MARTVPPVVRAVLRARLGRRHGAVHGNRRGARLHRLRHATSPCSAPGPSHTARWPVRIPKGFREPLIAPLYPLISGSGSPRWPISAAHGALPDARVMGPRCDGAFLAIDTWSSQARALDDTVKISYLSWPVLMAGAISLAPRHRPRTTRLGTGDPGGPRLSPTGPGPVSRRRFTRRTFSRWDSCSPLSPVALRGSWAGAGHSHCARVPVPSVRPPGGGAPPDPGTASSATRVLLVGSCHRRPRDGAAHGRQRQWSDPLRFSLEPATIERWGERSSGTLESAVHRSSILSRCRYPCALFGAARDVGGASARSERRHEPRRRALGGCVSLGFRLACEQQTVRATTSWHSP